MDDFVFLDVPFLYEVKSKEISVPGQVSEGAEWPR